MTQNVKDLKVSGTRGAVKYCSPHLLPEVDLCPAQMKLRWEIGEEAALEEREAIQNVLDKQDKG